MKIQHLLSIFAMLIAVQLRAQAQINPTDEKAVQPVNATAVDDQTQSLRPSPEPRPSPAPRPEPRPTPAPHNPEPRPTPGPHPGPQPGPHPGPQPGPHPGPQPGPHPGPHPGPQPGPHPGPHPGPQPGLPHHSGPRPNPHPGVGHGQYWGHPGWHDGGPRPGWRAGWEIDFGAQPFWYYDGLVLPPFAFDVGVPANEWQCTAFDENQNPYSASAPTQQEAAYNALYDCGGPDYAQECYLPQGYCELYQ